MSDLVLCKLRTLGLPNRIGPSDLKSNDEIRFRLQDDSDSDYEFEVQLISKFD